MVITMLKEEIDQNYSLFLFLLHNSYKPQVAQSSVFLVDISEVIETCMNLPMSLVVG